MKRLGNVYDKIASVENIALAFKKASRHKSHKKAVKQAISMREKTICNIRDILVSCSFKTSVYHKKTIYEPKRRTIYALPFFPDRIVHHAVMNILEPFWDARLIHDSYANRVGKGMHKGSTRCMEFVRRYRYVLQCDVSKFYQSVDHAILKRLLERQIKDRRLLELLFGVIDSSDKIRGATPGKNVPIGNLLSQWFGNVYLGELDKWIKQDRHVKQYIRYCDDFLLFSNDKEELNAIRNEIVAFLEERLALRLSKADIFRTTQGVDFLGYRHFPKYILLRKRNAKKVKRFSKRFFAGYYDKDMLHARGIAASYHGMLLHAQTNNLRNSVRFPDILKRVGISYEKILRLRAKRLQFGRRKAFHWRPFRGNDNRPAVSDTAIEVSAGEGMRSNPI